jgi:hypothetical protein
MNFSDAETITVYIEGTYRKIKAIAGLARFSNWRRIQVGGSVRGLAAASQPPSSKPS